MNSLRYSMVVVLISSSLCHGFTSTSLKHASKGIGKLGLGVICATAGASLATIEVEVNGVPRKALFRYAEKSLDDFYDYGLRDGLFRQPGAFYLSSYLMLTASLASSIGMSGYGTYKCVASACKSFKDAWNTRKKPSTQTGSGSSKIPAKESQKVELQPKDERLDVSNLLR